MEEILSEWNFVGRKLEIASKRLYKIRKIKKEEANQ